jgi:hypothetical protein
MLPDGQIFSQTPWKRPKKFEFGRTKIRGRKADFAKKWQKTEQIIFYQVFTK